uniref:Uncharacterized protein n=1 Tax=Cajanus cajan TaxID=3821 RepID=A0A151RXZ9_CAJCA|nr:hypothetical protein KK1_030963 [Cajanus cajan]
MQVNWLPQHMCDYLDKVGRSFIWKGSSDRGLQFVGWNHITRPHGYQNVAMLIN